MGFLESYNKSKQRPVNNKSKNEKHVFASGSARVVNFGNAYNAFRTRESAPVNRQKTKDMTEFEKEYQAFIEKLKANKTEE